MATKAADKLTLSKARNEFRIYFHDLKADARTDGYTVDAGTEWGLFIDNWALDGTIGAATAKEWRERGPRSVKKV